MGISIDEVIEELERTKDYPASDPASDEALDFAVDTMRKYQMMQADYKARLNADLVAMLTEIQLEITEKSYYDTTIIGNYEDEVRIGLVELNDVNDIIQQKIDALKAESEGEDEDRS